jgi:hypothetical protein
VYYKYFQDKQSNMIKMAAATSAAHITAHAKPFLLYGTAWKKEMTEQHVSDAIHTGFRFIDTFSSIGATFSYRQSILSIAVRIQTMFLMII